MQTDKYILVLKLIEIAYKDVYKDTRFILIELLIEINGQNMTFSMFLINLNSSYLYRFWH